MEPMRCKHLSSALFLCVFLGAAGCKESAHNNAPVQPLSVAEVRVVTVSGQAAQRQNEVAGSVEAIQKATIGARISGPIEEMPVTLGSAVKKGALLARISSGETAARLSQAETQLAQAQRNYEREKRLLEQDASTRETVRSLDETRLTAEAGVREARAIRDHALITAPFAGFISQKMANAGDLATPGMPLLILENTEKLQVVAAVPENLALKITRGDTLAVDVPAAGFSRTGIVTEIGPASDTASRTALLKIRVGGNGTLRPGQYARVTLPGIAGVDTFMVPESALSRLGQMERVFVIRNDTARLRLVRSGERRNGQVEILTGLNEGEQVVVQGGERLVDEQPVRLVP
jgi:RND family efflux transporter MFP subunit